MSVFGRLFRGTARILSAELLAIPGTLLILAVLTRTLGPSQFGHYVLVAAIINWVEWSLNTLFGRATIKLVGESKDWHKPAGTILQLHLIAAIFVAAMVVLFSKTIAGILHEPALSGYLRLFALDIPCWTIAQASRGILIARESFRERAWLSVARWLGRVSFTIPLVLLFPSVEAAICGYILASILEFVIARILISVPVRYGISTETVKKLFAYAAPLSALGLLLRVYDKTDLFILKFLGSNAQQTGIYGAAQNFSFGIGLLTMSLSAPLLGTLTRLRAEGSETEAAGVVSSTFRGVLLLLPFLALLSATSPEIVKLVFGKDYAATGPILSILLFSAFSMLIVSINTSVLIALGRELLPLLLALSMLCFAIASYLVLIPIYGLAGAASVTLTASGLLAVVSTFVVHSIRPIRIMPLSLLRIFLIALIAWWVGQAWQSAGHLLLVKLVVCAIMVSALFVFTGEVGKSDFDFVKKLLNRKKEPEPISI